MHEKKCQVRLVGQILAKLIPSYEHKPIGCYFGAVQCSAVALARRQTHQQGPRGPRY
jgi:hypothetical protein